MTMLMLEAALLLLASVIAGETDEMADAKRLFQQATEQLRDPPRFGEYVSNVRRSAALGYGEAQEHMATLYSYGIGVARSEALAVLHHTFAALNGVAEAHLVLSYRIRSGIGMETSCDEAAFHAEQAAQAALRASPIGIAGRLKKTIVQENFASNVVNHQKFHADQGSGHAFLTLGYIYWLGLGSATPDIKLAMSYLRRAIDEGESGALVAMGLIHTTGAAGEKNLPLAVEFLNKAAATTNDAALNALGYLYAHGEGVEQSYQTAYQYFLRARDAGSVEGAYNAAALIFHQKVAAPGGAELEKTFAFLRRALDHSSPHALWLRGRMSLYGYLPFIAPNCQEALQRFVEVCADAPSMTPRHELEPPSDASMAKLLPLLRASEWGHTKGLTAAAAVVQEWEDAEKDVEALLAVNRSALRLALLHRAADGGDAAAQLELGNAHYYGSGASLDAARAFEYYQRAAAKGLPEALFNVGWMYFYGVGVKQDFYLAKRSLDRASESGKGAKTAVDLAFIQMNLHLWVRHFEGLKGKLTSSFPVAIFGLPLDDGLLFFSLGTTFILAVIRNNIVAN